MQIENITRIGLTARRTLQQQAQGPVGHGVFGKIVIHDQHIPALFHKILTQGAAGIGSDVLQGRTVAGACVDDDGILHGPSGRQIFNQLGDGAGFLTDGHIDADHVFPLLVQDRIHGDGRFSRLTVSDDQLTLSLADGKHGIDGQQSGLHRLVDALTVKNAGGRMLDGTVSGSFDLALSVGGSAQRVNDSSEEAFSHGHTCGFARAFDGTSLNHKLTVAKKDAADIIPLKFLGHAPDPGIKQQDLSVSGIFQAGHDGDPIRHRKHFADLFRNYLGSPAADGVPQQRDDGLVLLMPDPADVGLQLRKKSFFTPVVNVGANLQPEAVFQRFILDPFQDRIFPIFAFEEIVEPFPIFLAGRYVAEQPGG